MLHVGVVQAAAAAAHRLDDAVGLLRHHLGALVGHQPGDGQLDQRKLFAPAHHNDAAAHLLQPVRGLRHVRLVGADDDHVVAVMRHRAGDCAIGAVAEA
jgi:hypothetical protein